MQFMDLAVWNHAEGQRHDCDTGYRKPFKFKVFRSLQSKINDLGQLQYVFFVTQASEEYGLPRHSNSFKANISPVGYCAEAITDIKFPLVCFVFWHQKT